ncbi:hypothetical protein F2P81_004123 [Scophthalmus maximus]|uniref:Uncharacterized protein n=1 Tax=Scophthalmus maximus TaxID=52904 RepID=A0A6A4T5C9_SCOMX|nr:hypothetical protein F2P81_004123 [Scophthalmus maximus]
MRPDGGGGYSPDRPVSGSPISSSAENTTNPPKKETMVESRVVTENQSESGERVIASSIPSVWFFSPVQTTAQPPETSN